MLVKESFDKRRGKRCINYAQQTIKIRTTFVVLLIVYNAHEKYAKVMTFIIVLRKFLHNFCMSLKLFDKREKCEKKKKNQNIVYEFKGNEKIYARCVQWKRKLQTSHTQWT